MVCEPVGKAGAHQLLKIVCRHAPSWRSINLIGPCDVIAVAPVGTASMAWSHRPTLPVKKFACEQTGLLVLPAPRGSRRILRERLLHSLEQILVHDRLVFAGMR